MPTHLKALLVILILGTTVFVFSKVSVCSVASTPEDFTRRRNLWFAITLIGFLSNNFWIFIIITAMVLLFAVRRESNRLALFFFLLLVLPPFGQQISGLGIFQHLFTINYLRLLALTILMSSFLSLWKSPSTLPFGRSLPDKLIAGYLLLVFLLMLSNTTLTDTIRHGFFYNFIDIFLPYYVASRSIKSLQDFRDALMAFAVGALVIGVVGVFEASRHWLLYASLSELRSADFMRYLVRDGGQLRAQGSTGHAIVLGYVMAVALGFFMFLRRVIPSTRVWVLGLGTLVAGLIAPLSRGPWVGVAAMLLVLFATGPSPLLRLMQVGMLGTIAYAALLVIPSGDRFVGLLPFVGTDSESASTVTYRERLLEIGIEVLLKNPLFGRQDFLISQEAEE